MDSLKNHFDAIVIGSGPGGEGAAIMLAKSGKSVAIVENRFLVGGGCTHLGTIPSKALIHVVQQYAEDKKHRLFNRGRHPGRVTRDDLMDAINDVVAQQVRDREDFYERNHITIVAGHACFTDPHTVEVQDDTGNLRQMTADYFVIASGSHPYHPEDVPFDTPRVVDSDTILKMDELPGTLTVYGAGVIGCEYASIFANLDVKVNLVNTRDRLMSFLDDEITDALSYHLRDQGVVILHNEMIERVESSEKGVVLRCQSGKEVHSDVLFWANGRTGNTDDMGLEEIGVEINYRGQVEVDETFRTTVGNIFAVGDVIGPPALASASYDQGRFAGEFMVDGGCDWELLSEIPTGIYTSPEISSVGRTEKELTEQNIPYEVGRADFKNLARAQIAGRNVGMLKLLFHRETLEILGIHCFGETAAEIIHIGQAIMGRQGEANSLRYFAETTFNYPTMAEAYREAALNGLNWIF